MNNRRTLSIDTSSRFCLQVCTKLNVPSNMSIETSCSEKTLMNIIFFLIFFHLIHSSMMICSRLVTTPSHCWGHNPGRPTCFWRLIIAFLLLKFCYLINLILHFPISDNCNTSSVYKSVPERCCLPSYIDRFH